MPERSQFQAIGDTATIVLPKDFNGTVTGILTPGTAVGGVVVLELSEDDGTTWEIASLNRPDRTIVASLNQGQSGWCEAPSYTMARLRLTALTSGIGQARITARPG